MEKEGSRIPEILVSGRLGIPGFRRFSPVCTRTGGSYGVFRDHTLAEVTDGYLSNTKILWILQLKMY
jgi:hypothetical protein